MPVTKQSLFRIIRWEADSLPTDVYGTPGHEALMVINWPTYPATAMQSQPVYLRMS